MLEVDIYVVTGLDAQDVRWWIVQVVTAKDETNNNIEIGYFGKGDEDDSTF